MRLETRNVDYSYRSQKNKHILQNVSLMFQEATFYTIIGASGAGKTTLLSLLAGLDLPTNGAILYNAKDIKVCGLNYHRKHHISLVFQSYNLINYLTTKENVMLGGRSDPEQLLASVNIPGEDWNRNILQLSGGQQQRVAIARALASEADVLLADEPTGNLDKATADDIIKLLKYTAHELGKCVIVVTHSQQLAKQSDEVIQIEDGKVSIRVLRE